MAANDFLTFQTDLQRFPVVEIVFPRRTSLEGIDLHIANLRALFEQRGPFAIVADINPLDPLSASAQHRAHFAAAIDELAQRDVFLAEAVIASSAVIRGLYTAYSWFRERKSYPMACFSTRTEATNWVEEVLRARSSPS